MNKLPRFEIDFSEAKAILHPPHQDHKAVRVLRQLRGFFPPEGVHNGSGLCALGTVLHFHGIGWNHIARDRQGHPDNNAFVEELKRWSKTPDLLCGSMGTSPSRMLQSLRKAGLIANWYSGNPLDVTLPVIRSELQQARPVIALLNHGPRGEPLLLEWRVIGGLDAQHIVLVQGESMETSQAMRIGEFAEAFQTGLQALSCSILTARKE